MRDIAAVGVIGIPLNRGVIRRSYVPTLVLSLVKTLTSVVVTVNSVLLIGVRSLIFTEYVIDEVQEGGVAVQSRLIITCDAV